MKTQTNHTDYSAFTASARSLFQVVYKGKANFMTPYIVEYGFICGNKYAYEISKGKGIFTELMFGVTIINVSNQTPNYDLSKGGFSELKEALEYLNSILN